MQLKKKPDFHLDSSTDDSCVDSPVEQKVKSEPSQVNGKVVELLPESLPDIPKTKLRPVSVWVLWVLIIATSVAIVGAVLALPSFMSCGTDKVKEAEGKMNLGAMNRSQQAYYLENSTFSSSFDTLGLGTRTETVNYRYSTRATKNAAFNYAIPRGGTKTLKSYVGAVFPVPATNFNPKVDKKEILTVSIMCETLRPSRTQPSEPTLVKGVPACSADTKELTRLDMNSRSQLAE